MRDREMDRGRLDCQDLGPEGLDGASAARLRVEELFANERALIDRQDVRDQLDALQERHGRLITSALFCVALFAIAEVAAFWILVAGFRALTGGH